MPLCKDTTKPVLDLDGSNLPESSYGLGPSQINEEHLNNSNNHELVQLRIPTSSMAYLKYISDDRNIHYNTLIELALTSFIKENIKEVRV